MRFGPKCEDGFLPVYSVGTEEEAQKLLVLACQRNLDGDFIASELVMEQTLENLAEFSDRLDRAHEHLVARGHCTCRRGDGEEE